MARTADKAAGRPGGKSGARVDRKRPGRASAGDPASRRPTPASARGGPATGRGPGSSGSGGGAVSALGERLLTVLTSILEDARPADLLLRDFFRAQAALGRRERGQIAETVFDVLRHKRLYSHWAQSGFGPMQRRLVLLSQMRRSRAADGPAAPVTLAGARVPLIADDDEQVWLTRIAGLSTDGLSPAVRLSLPDWLMQTLIDERGGGPAEAIAAALLGAAPLDLRVNSLSATVPEAIARLAADRIVATAREGVPGALRVEGKPALERSAVFTDGGVEVQDSGSQVLAQLVSPRRGQTVVDFCAGAGGKTLALAALLRGSGQVFACDVSLARLQKLRPRLARAGASNVQPMAIDNERDPKLVRLAGRADAVLVDAPCSGSGTLRRNPDLKWRLEPAEVERLHRLQGSILEAAARLVKPGGVLVYATCSVLSAENQRIAEAFSQAHPEFVIDPVQPLLARLEIGVGRRDEPASPYLELRPDLDDCDGFFAARWIRAKTPQGTA